MLTKMGPQAPVRTATGQYRSKFFRVGLQSKNGASHSFVHSLIHSFPIFSFSSYSLLGTILSDGDEAVIEGSKVLSGEVIC